jgi:8-oxo-dGTP diphosphatase
MSARIPHVFLAVYLIPMRGNEVMLLRRFNTGYQDGKYSLIAGHVEPGESITAALCREAKEEAGIELDERELEFKHVMQRFCPDGRVYLDFFFTVNSWHGEILNCEPSRCDELAWYDLNHLPATLIPYVRDALDRVVGLTKFSEYTENRG